MWLCFPQASALPMSIIIVGVGPAEFDGKFAVSVFVFMCKRDRLLVWPAVIGGLLKLLPCALRYTMTG